MIKIIEDNGITYAKIVKAGHDFSKTEFFTNETDEIQFGVVNFDKNFKTGAHYHNKLKHKTTPVDEILMVQKGKMRVDFYNDKGVYIKSYEVNQGDVIILNTGGHNIFFMEETKVFQIKTGAYDKNLDTTRIVGANNLELIIEK